MRAAHAAVGHSTHFQPFAFAGPSSLVQTQQPPPPHFQRGGGEYKTHITFYNTPLTSPLFVLMHILLYLKFISLLPPPPSVRDALWFLFCFRLEMCLFLLSFLHIFYFSLLSCL